MRIAASSDTHGRKRLSEPVLTADNHYLASRALTPCASLSTQHTAVTWDREQRERARSAIIARTRDQT
jgi:hypothetical protein